MSEPRKAIAVLTFKTREHIFRVGGTCSWAVNRAHARSYEFAVCVRNANTRSSDGPEAHGTAFLVGRIADVVTSPENSDRWLLKFSEYAEIDAPDTWGKGWRNPVRYTSLEELGIELESLVFQPMPDIASAELGERQNDVRRSEIMEDRQPRKISISEAKEGLAAMFDVPIEAIEISIRG